MKAVILTLDQFQDLLKRLEEIKHALSNKNIDVIGDSYLTNKQLSELLGVSKRTLQNWRDQGKISFSQIGNKIFYKRSDIDSLMERHLNQSFRD